MESRAKLAGHPVHQQLIVFPLGLLSTAVIFDVLQKLTGNEAFSSASYYMIAAGVIAGLVAAVFGTIDFLGIPAGTRAKRVATVHGLGNVVVVVLFAVSWLLRGDAPGYVASAMPLTIELVAAALATATGWLGGELLNRLGVGIDPAAHLDAPASYETSIGFGGPQR